MSGLTTTRAGNYIDDSVGTSVRTAPTTPMKLSVETVAGTAGAAGTELGSTTRPSIAFGAATGTPPVASNSAQVTVVAGASGTVVAHAVYDSAATPIRVWWGPLSSSRAVVTGDSLVYAAAAITLSITS